MLLSSEFSEEALQNTVKHSAGKRVEVQLREDSKALYLLMEIQARVSMSKQHRLAKVWVISMRERIRLVNGTINIDSKSNGGTAIEIRVPLELQSGQTT